MIRRPPRSTLFSSRRSSDLFAHVEGRRAAVHALERVVEQAVEVAADLGRRKTMDRSEEHTSELQSLTNLVCRLLLEKKKKNNTQQEIRDTNYITCKYQYTNR